MSAPVGGGFACAAALLCAALQTSLLAVLLSIDLVLRSTLHTLSRFFHSRSKNHGGETPVPHKKVKRGKKKQKKNSNADDPRSDRIDCDTGCHLFKGTVMHVRREPVKHSFEYPVRFAIVNVDFPPAWFKATSSRHHRTGDEVRELAGTDGPV